MDFTDKNGDEIIRNNFVKDSYDIMKQVKRDYAKLRVKIKMKEYLRTLAMKEN